MKNHLFIFIPQNCTVWEGGSLGQGDLTAFQVVAYVVATTTKPADPADVASTIQEHDDFDFFGLDLSMTHDPNYSSFVGGGGVATTTAPPSTSTAQSSSSVPSSTSTASGAVQTQYGQVRDCTDVCFL